MMKCKNCEEEIYENDTYYDTEYEILCSDCIDFHLNDLKDEYERIYNLRAEKEDLDLDISRGK